MATKIIIVIFMLVLPTSLASEALLDTQQRLVDCREDYEALAMEYNASRQAKLESEESLAAIKDNHFFLVSTILGNDSQVNTDNMTFPMVVTTVKSELNNKNVEIALLKQQVNQSHDQIEKLESENQPQQAFLSSQDICFLFNKSCSKMMF